MKQIEIEQLEEENDQLQALLCALALQNGKPLVISAALFERGKQAILVRAVGDGGTAGVVVDAIEEKSLAEKER